MQFRKIAAVTGSAIMAGMTFAGAALAAVTNVADFGMLSSVSDGKAQMPLFVVGAQAKTSDVAAAINLAARLAGNAVTTEKITTAATGASADGIVFRTELANTTALTRDFDSTSTVTLQPKTRGGRPATFLTDNSLTLGGTEYKYYEVIGMGASHVTGTATTYYLQRGTTGTGQFEDALTMWGFSMPANDLYYNLSFETPIYVGSNNLTGQSIKFLGGDYTVISSTTTNVQLSPVAGAQTISEGTSAEVGGYTIKVDSVAASGTAKAAITVCKGDVCSGSTTFNEGDQKDVTVGSTVVPVTVQTIILGRAASVLAGGATFKLEGGNTLKNYPDWTSFIQAAITGDTNRISFMGMRYKNPHTAFTGTNPVLLEGKEILIPTGLAKLKYIGLEERNYITLTMTATTGDFNGNPSNTEQGVTYALTDTATGTAVKSWDTGGIFADTVVYDLDTGAWMYKNSTGGYLAVGNNVNTTGIVLSLSEKTYIIGGAFGAGSGGINAGNGLTLHGQDADAVMVLREPDLTEDTVLGTSGRLNWTIEVDYNYQSTSTPRFENITSGAGINGTATDPNYLSYGYSIQNQSLTGERLSALAVAYGGSTPKAKSGFRSNYGTKVTGAAGTTITFEIPKLQIYGDLLLGREAGAGTSGGVTTQKVAPVTFDVAKLDTEVDTSALTGDVVVVGGPCVNQLAAKLLDKTYPACDVASGITKDTALVQVFQNAFGSGKVAFLVAGWEAADTENAAAALQAGTIANKVAAVTVAGTTVTEVTATPAAE